MTPTPALSETLASYSRAAGHATFGFAEPEHPELAPFADTVHAATPGDTPVVLDLCCGAGRDAAHLAARGFHVLGVDANRDQLATATDTAPTAAFACAWADHLPLADATADAVWANAAILHVDRDHAERILAEAARVAKPYAPLYLSTRMQHYCQEPALWEDHPFGRRWIQRWTATDLHASLAATGWSVRHIDADPQTARPDIHWLRAHAVRAPLVKRTGEVSNVTHVDATPLALF